MANVSTREQFKNYCLRELGHPVIKINIDDEQLDDRVDEAIQYYNLFHYDGTEKVYVTHQITSTDISNKYFPVGDGILGITRVFPTSFSSSTINMFDIRYQMRFQDIQSFTTGSINYYWTVMTHLRELEMILMGEEPIRFNYKTGRLYIDWDWDYDAIEGKYCIIEAQAIIDPEVYPKMYNDRMLKLYATALIKRQWASNISKYAGITLPGQIQLNGPELFRQANEEVDRLEKEIRDTYEAPPMFMVG